MRKRVPFIILTIAIITTLISGCTIGGKEYVLDFNYVGRNDVLSINGEEISMEETLVYLCNYQNLYGNAYGVNLWDYEFSTEDAPVTLEEYVKDITLLQLSNIMCMNQLAKENNVTLTEEELKLAEQAAREYYTTLTEAEVAYMCVDEKEVKSFYEKYALAEKMYRRLTQGVNEEVSVDEARVMRIQMIFVTTADRAEEIEQKLDEGKDFLTVANSYNEGKQIELIVARGDLEKTLEAATYALADGEWTKQIKTEDGYYFIKCISKNEEELTEKNKENIIVKRRKEQFEDVFNAFVEESVIEINQKAWEGVVMDTSGDIVTDSFFEVYDRHFTEE